MFGALLRRSFAGLGACEMLEKVSMRKLKNKKFKPFFVEYPWLFGFCKIEDTRWTLNCRDSKRASTVFENRWDPSVLRGSFASCACKRLTVVLRFTVVLWFIVSHSARYPHKSRGCINAFSALDCAFWPRTRQILEYSNTRSILRERFLVQFEKFSPEFHWTAGLIRCVHQCVIRVDCAGIFIRRGGSTSPNSQTFHKTDFLKSECIQRLSS